MGWILPLGPSLLTVALKQYLGVVCRSCSSFPVAAHSRVKTTDSRGAPGNAGRTCKEVVMRSDSSLNSGNQRRENGFKMHLWSWRNRRMEMDGLSNPTEMKKIQSSAQFLGDKILVFTILSWSCNLKISDVSRSHPQRSLTLWNQRRGAWQLAVPKIQPSQRQASENGRIPSNGL